ncbi:MAG: MotA/TolQ/ExbB proton channel family protein [Bacteroidota bacterium]
MKKLFAFIAVFGLLSFGAVNFVQAQVEDTAQVEGSVEDTTKAEEGNEEEQGTATTPPAEDAGDESGSGAAVAAEKSIHHVVRKQFIEGGPMFMSFVLIALILGLALAIERIIYLNLATTNTGKLLQKVESALETGGVEAAKEVCRNTRGPVASIFYQGLDRAHLGLEAVEKSLISYGNVQMGLLEKGLSWISLFIAVAPMLGFMGTVIGMIDAFDKIQVAGEARPDEVAGGIKIALITTVSGLIVAIILQFFYNYLISKIDGIVNKMEDASISLIDLLVKHNVKA